MAGMLILLTFAAYNELNYEFLFVVDEILSFPYPFFKLPNIPLCVFVIGMLSREELPGYRVIENNRVSGSSQGSSLESQEEDLDDEYHILEKRYGAELVETYSVTESASTMDRETMDEILTAAENDEFDILMVWRVHRLTRADPWETVSFLLDLRKHGIILYADNRGYFDWSDPNDFDQLMSDITTSREWRNEIVDGSLRGYRSSLEDGEWPYPDDTYPYGTTESKEGKIVIKEGYEWVYSAVHKAYHASTEDESNNTIEDRLEYVKNKINPRLKEEDKELLSNNQIEYILENDIFTGKLRLPITDEVVREKKDLKQVDPKLFTKTQDLRRQMKDDDNGSDGPGIQDFPEFVYQVIARFGQEHVVSNIAAIRWCCPQCRSTDLNISATMIEQWEINMPKIYCKNDACGYIGAPIRLKELHEIDYSLPLICSHCQRTNRFEVEDVQFGDDLYKYTCQYCDDYMIINKPPNKTKRALENPENAISIHDPKAEINEPDVDTQQTLSSYT